MLAWSTDWASVVTLAPVTRNVLHGQVHWGMVMVEEEDRWGK